MTPSSNRGDVPPPSIFAGIFIRTFRRRLAGLLFLLGAHAPVRGQTVSPGAITVANSVETSRVVAWGAKGFNYGQSSPPIGLTDATSVAAGVAHTVALRNDGTVVAWGDNYVGQTDVPVGLREVIAVACGDYFNLALKRDGTVVAWGDNSSGATDVPPGLSNVVAIAAGSYHAAALRTDGVVTAWGDDAFGATSVPGHLKGVKAIAAGAAHTLALTNDGTVVAWGAGTSKTGVGFECGQSVVPAGLTGVSAIAAGGFHSVALKTDGTVVTWGDNYIGQVDVPANLYSVSAIAAGNFFTMALTRAGTLVSWGRNEEGQATAPTTLAGVFAIAAGDTHAVAVTRTGTSLTSVLLPGAGLAAGSTAVLNASGFGAGTGSYQWARNGGMINGATSEVLRLTNFQPVNTGIYTATASGQSSALGNPAIVGLFTTSKTVGSAAEILANQFVAFNNNTFDQVALQGAAAVITADADQITRISFVDLTDDIVQVEFSGAGSLALVLDGASGPAAPVKYEQPGVNYMKGNAGIVITDANETTNVSVFSVGRITAANQKLFIDGLTYDGVADIAFIAISSTNGRFGGIRAANANFLATKGLTGIYAPGVVFTGPVYLADIKGFDLARPVLVLGGAMANTWITGGDLRQPNNQPIQVKGLTTLLLTNGTDSHGQILPAKTLGATLQEDGIDVTVRLVPAQNR